MQRKALFITVAVMLSLLVCARVQASVEIHDNRTEEAVEEDYEFSEEDFEIKEYLCPTSYDLKGYIVIKNNSEEAAAVDITGTAYDSSGGEVSTEKSEIVVIGPGEQSIAEISFYPPEKIDHVEYEYQYKKSMYEPVLSNLGAEVFLNNKNVIIAATNNGEKPIQFLLGYVLFFDSNNNLVDTAYNSFSDNDFELKPSGSYASQFGTDEVYDHIECYFTGWFDGKAAETQGEVGDKDFDIKEYTYTGDGFADDYLIITNNSDKNVEISGNAGAIGSSGKMVGATNCDLYILAPGETSIAVFHFWDLDESVDHVDYHLFYDTAPMYAPVIGDLSAETSIKGNNIEVSVTNNGTGAAKYVSAYVLCFDADGNVVGYDRRYFTEGESAINPGETVSKQFSKSEDFDHFEVYLDGIGKKT